ncbi:hypothetical protein MTO96_034472 [Rhipicephalus appendiculatus]
MGEHLRASCGSLTAQQATECEEKLSDAMEKGISTVVRRVVQEQAAEMKALLEQALRDNGALNDSLSEVSQSMNSLKESVSHGIAPLSEMTHRVMDGMNTLRGALHTEMADIKKQNAEEFPRVRAAIQSAKEDSGANTKTILEIQKKTLAHAEEIPRVRAAIESGKEEAVASRKTMLEMQKKALAYAEKSGTRCDFFVPGIESLEAKAMTDGKAEYFHGPVYLRGYNISPGVELKTGGESVVLRSLLKLYKGDHDEEIQWPFEHKFKCTILHRVENAEKVSILKTNRALKSYQKPTNSMNTGVVFSDNFNIEDLKTGGYICDDMLRVVWELL